MNGTGDLRRLFFDLNNDLTRVKIAPLVDMIIPDLLQRVSNNLLIVHLRLRSNLTENHDHVSLRAGLTGNTGVWILSKTGIKDCVRDLVTELVWMTFIDTLRSEDEVVLWNCEYTCCPVRLRHI
jgi:hypothetical protein